MDEYSKFWYYQLERDFFKSAGVRRLRRKFGPEGVVIYLQLILLSITDEGYIEYKGAVDSESFVEELAFDIQEEGKEDLIRDVLAYCMQLGLIVSEVENTLLYIPDVTGKVKTLSQSGKRMRKKRAEEKKHTQENKPSAQSDAQCAEEGNAQSDAQCAEYSNSNNKNNSKSNSNIKNKKEKEKEKKEIPVIFEEIWNRYPVQQGKDRACRAFVQRIQEGWDPEELQAAAFRYSDYCLKNNIDERFIIRPWNFYGSEQPFTDYLAAGEDEEEIKAVEYGTDGNRPVYNHRSNFFV